MPREIINHRMILDAIKHTGIISELTSKTDEHYNFELDLEVIVYGRTYAGQRVGPYLRLFAYDAGEEIFREGDWGNTFYIVVEGRLDVLIKQDEGVIIRVGEIQPGSSFGEMSILASVQRNATVVVPYGSQATVLEVARPALRLLRKLEFFGRNLDKSYRQHLLGRTLVEIQAATGNAYTSENLKCLSQAARPMIYGKQHVLIQEGKPIDRVILIANGWLKRVRRLGAQLDDNALAGYGWNQHVDFLGGGYWLGLEGVSGEARWDYTATVMQRTEVLEISLSQLRYDPQLRDALRQSLHDLALAYDESSPTSSAAEQLALEAVETEITTGVVDASNLLVMDMDLCVRCGNCSFACHKVHGQSRLMRRGISIERPIKLRSASGQNVLVPEVCIHCQDPPCLTGCPTGAIGRLADGQIDINPKTCIGCSDCATQCPYNAITMVPRKAPAPPPRSFTRRLRAFFDLRRTPPPHVVDVHDLVAITCNLCRDTPLNPPGARRQAYSCQENCPTGALVRVNPLEYFTEAKNRISLVYRDKTHAIGRNIHKRDTFAKLLHACGIATVIALTFTTVWGILRYGLETPLGSSWLTMRWITGLGGLGGTAVAFAYAARKQIYRRRAGPLRYWMKVHVYAGIAAGIILLLHAGNSPGRPLTSLLTVSLYLTLLTGVFGSACYLICPRLLTDLEGEPLLIEELRARRVELREQLTDINRHCTPEVKALIHARVYKRFFTLSFLLRQYLRREKLSALLAVAREETASELDSALDREEWRVLSGAVDATVTLRRVDALIYLHQLLKLWLIPHIWTAMLTTVLMLWHIAQVSYSAASR